MKTANGYTCKFCTCKSKIKLSPGRQGSGDTRLRPTTDLLRPFKRLFYAKVKSQGPHSHILRQRSIFYTQKNPNFRICLPKKIPTFFSIPKKIPQVSGYLIHKIFTLYTVWSWWLAWKALNYVTYWIFLSGLDEHGVPVIAFHIDYSLRNIP